MRFVEIVNGFLTPVNNEENVLLDHIQSNSPVSKESLNEREQELARNLTSRGVLIRFKIDDKLHFKLNLK